MSQIKHTPGPWALQLANSGARIIAHGEVICQGMGGNRANARLIAAAPDLLEALKSALALLEDHYPNPAPNGQIAKARAAIAKSEGQP